MIRNLVCGHHLCFSLVACEDDDLSRICLLQPLQRGVQTVFVVQYEAVIKELRASHPEANIIAVDYDPGASEVNQLNRIKLMLATAQKQLHAESNKAIS